MTVRDYKKLKRFLLSWEDLQEIVTYQIVETFNARGDTYNVMNISIFMEDGVIYFSDIDDVILNKQRSVMKGFLISSAELVEFYKDRFCIRLKDATIEVKVIQ